MNNGCDSVDTIIITSGFISLGCILDGYKGIIMVMGTMLGSLALLCLIEVVRSRR